MNIEVHWQDADSSSNAVTEHFPKAKVMICGGHAGRAHKKKRSFSDDFKRKHEGEFPTINEVACCCSSRHRPGCGCMTDAFVERARNNFSFVLSDSQSAEFARRIKVLPRHARNQHIWDGGQCDFHPLQVCSCGSCSDSGELQESPSMYSLAPYIPLPMRLKFMGWLLWLRN